MYQTSATTLIEAPREFVFAALSDPSVTARCFQSIETIELVERTPQVIGTRYRETRQIDGKPVTTELVVVDFEPPVRMALVANGRRTRNRIEVRVTEPEPGLSRLETVNITAPIGLMGRLLGLAGGLFVGPAQRSAESDLDRLAELVERRTRAALRAGVTPAEATARWTKSAA